MENSGPRSAIKGALRKSQIDCAFTLTCGNDVSSALRCQTKRLKAVSLSGLSQLGSAATVYVFHCGVRSRIFRTEQVFPGSDASGVLDVPSLPPFAFSPAGAFSAIRDDDDASASSLWRNHLASRG